MRFFRARNCGSTHGRQPILQKQKCAVEKENRERRNPNINPAEKERETKLGAADFIAEARRQKNCEKNKRPRKEGINRRKRELAPQAEKKAGVEMMENANADGYQEEEADKYPKTRHTQARHHQPIPDLK